MNEFSMDEAIEKAKVRVKTKEVQTPPRTSLSKQIERECEPRRKPVFWGYARVSSYRQATETESVHDQTKRLENYFRYRHEGEGYEFGKIFVEPAYRSASKIMFEDRPAGRELIDTVRPGDVVVFDRLDRGFRNQFDMLKTLRLFEEMNVDVIFLNFGDQLDFNVSTPMGKLVLSIISIFAEEEARVIGLRTKHGIKERRARGIFHKRLTGLIWAEVDGKKVPTWDERYKFIRERMFYYIEVMKMRHIRACERVMFEWFASQNKVISLDECHDALQNGAEIDGFYWSRGVLKKALDLEQAFRLLGIKTPHDYVVRKPEVTAVRKYQKG